MSFSDRPFPYGPFVPHWVPKQYIENYFAWQRTDSCLVMNTAVEDVSRLNERWKLTLRRVDQTRHVDIWWEEEFDALIIANGHYSVPFVCNALTCFRANARRSLPSKALVSTWIGILAGSCIQSHTAPPTCTRTKRFLLLATRLQDMTSRRYLCVLGSRNCQSTNLVARAPDGMVSCPQASNGNP